MGSYRFEEVVDRLRQEVDVQLLGPGKTASTVVADRDVHRPGMGLMGYTEGFLPERVQVFGESEIGYLKTLDHDDQRAAVGRILDLEIPGAFVSSGLDVPVSMLDEAERRGIPIARVELPSHELIDLLRDVLEDLFAARTNIHGTLVDVYGVGLLLTGRSGVGKSETALDLIERGHRLVADDMVEVTRRGHDVLLGTGRETLKHHMEIRGIGIVDVFPIFGVRALRVQKRIEVEVCLEDWIEGKNYDRLGLDRGFSDILSVRIPQVTVPIVPGKNITVIAEVLALDFMLKTYGIDSAEMLNTKILESMEESGRTARYLKHDIE